MKLLERFDGERTLFYLDPPYVHSTRSSLQGRSKRTHGYAHELTDDDHRELARRVRELRGMVMISGYRCPLYDELYGDWQSLSKRSRTESAKIRTEVLWFSPNCGANSNGHLFA
jgi:DNA adenine methylase